MSDHSITSQPVKPLLAFAVQEDTEGSGGIVFAKTSAELCEAVDEIGSYLTRTVAKLVDRGIVKNLRPGKGHRALYAISRPTGEDSPANEGEGR